MHYFDGRGSAKDLNDHANPARLLVDAVNNSLVIFESALGNSDPVPFFDPDVH
jgi:hypothetical protein